MCNPYKEMSEKIIRELPTRKIKYYRKTLLQT